MKVIMKFKNVILAFCLVISICSCNNNTHTYLTQLSPQSYRQMMGYLIKTDNNKVIVIDGGTTDDTNNLIKHINRNGGKVDYWFLTHAHDDHVGAFTQIVNETNIKINNIYVSLNNYNWYEKNEPERKEFTKKLMNTLYNGSTKEKVHEPKINEIINIDNIQVEVLGVKNPEIIENAGNEQSMVLKFKTNSNNLLILGDTGVNSSNKLIQTQGNKLNSNIVQMAHHGQNGATEELYKNVKPKICLWPTPDWLWDNNIDNQGINTGPWKTLETREWMKKLLVENNYVAKDGDVTIPF